MAGPRITSADLDGPRLASLRSLKFLAKEIFGAPWGTVHDELETFLKTSGKRKLVMFPRGHLKTMVVTKAWTIQQALNNPDIRILIANATWDNSRKFLGSIKSYLKTGNVMSQLFGPFESANWNVDECTIRQRKATHDAPTWTTTGLERELTSQHFDLIICDDLVAFENSTTPAQREKVKEYYGMLYALLEPNGTLLAMGTRYHQDDLYAQILADKTFDTFVRTAYTDDRQQAVIYPERFSVESLNEIRRDSQMGSRKFSAQYLNNPIDPDNADFRKEQIKYYEIETRHPGSLYMAVDPAISLSREADYSALVVAGQFQSRKIRVVDYLQKKMVPNDLVDAIFEMVKKHKLHRIGIETFAFQKTLKYDIQRQQRERNIFFSIDEIGKRRGANAEPILSKEARIRRLQPYFEQGLIELRPDMQAMVDEILAFPRGRHDDLIDALSMTLDYLVPSMDGQSQADREPAHNTVGWWLKHHMPKPERSIYQEFFSDLKK